LLVYGKSVNPIESKREIHYENYQKVIKRFENKTRPDPFTLPPEAVLKKLIHALESPRPKIRYYVTFPAYLLSTLKWLLPTRAMDWLLRRISANEN